MLLLRALTGAVVLALAPPPAPVTRSSHLLGRSVEGRPIRALELRGAAPEATVLVVGCIHGDECAGLAVMRELERSSARQLDLWLVPSLNPDGQARGTRQNAHGVDLNRNFPSGWRPSPRGLEYAGPRPFSERESRIARSLVQRLHPRLTLWFHQRQAVVRAWGRSIPAARAYARAARVPFRAIAWPHGTAPNWQNHRFPGCPAFVVELPPGALSRPDAHRYAAALLASWRAARC